VRGELLIIAVNPHYFVIRYTQAKSAQFKNDKPPNNLKHEVMYVSDP
jgi:hypothetical protein